MSPLYNPTKIDTIHPFIKRIPHQKGSEFAFCDTASTPTRFTCMHESMPRKARIEYEGAVYHVLNRGNYRSNIFSEDGARFAFLKCLDEACTKSAWIVHAWAIMKNHYHLAVETPRANLVSGMRWLQSTFAARFNRFRSENGHLFQGRYKAIVVDPDRSLESLCQYIHLNPIRAGVVSIQDLPNWPWSSCKWLFKKPLRQPWFEPNTVLSNGNGYKDNSTGHQSYLDYLAELSNSAGQQRDRGFDRMSKGWAHGSRDFKKGLLDDQEPIIANLSLGGNESTEFRELFWEHHLSKMVRRIRPGLRKETSKSADWKVALAALMKQQTTATNKWLAERLNMGSPFTVSRLTSECIRGDRAIEAFERLSAKSKL